MCLLRLLAHFTPSHAPDHFPPSLMLEFITKRKVYRCHAIHALTLQISMTRMDDSSSILPRIHLQRSRRVYLSSRTISNGNSLTLSGLSSPTFVHVWDIVAPSYWPLCLSRSGNRTTWGRGSCSMSVRRSWVYFAVRKSSDVGDLSTAHITQ